MFVFLCGQEEEERIMSKVDGHSHLSWQKMCVSYLFSWPAACGVSELGG
jgi:hypothetical protein